MYKNEIDTFSPDDISASLLVAIRTTQTSNPRPAAYLVPLNEILEQPGDAREKCVVIPMPGKSSSDIDYNHDGIYADFHMRPDGTFFDCLMLARGSVALYANIVFNSGATHYDRLYVLWIFDDKLSLSRYRVDDELAEDLWLMSKIAENHNYPPDVCTKSIEFVQHVELQR